MTRPDQPDDGGMPWHTRMDAGGRATIGPQGTALVAELQRLQSALDRDRHDRAGRFAGDYIEPAYEPPRATRGARGHRHAAMPGTSAIQNALDACLGVLGLGPRFRTHRAAARRPDAIIPRTGERMARTKTQPAVLRPRQDGGHNVAPVQNGTEAAGFGRSPADLDARPRPLAAGSPADDGTVVPLLERLRRGGSFLIGGVPCPPADDTPEVAFAVRVGRAVENELRTGLRVLIASVGILGGWATLVPLSGAVVVPGVLVVESNVKKVQHQSGGIVAQIPVRDGVHVDTGDLVLRLDETQVRANHQVLMRQLDQVRVRMARLLAERDGTDAPRPPRELAARLAEEDLGQLWASEIAFFAGRAAARRSAKDLLATRISQLGEQISGQEAQVKSRAAQRDLISGELEGVESLFEKGLVPLTRKTSLQREAARLEGDRGQAAAAIAETRSKVSETELQATRVDQDFRTEIMKDLSEAQDKERELVEKGVAAQDLLTRIEIRAPTAGIVHQLSAHTVGGVIAAGEVVMEIVPDTDELQIEARLPPQHIDQVRRGQTTFVRFSAFNQRTTPQLEGRVAYISADLSHDAQTSSAYYTVRITLSDDERRRLHGLHLVSGMPAEVFLQTGTRTMMSYLFKPISDQLQRMFSEP
jgi:HlyD family secretion protein